VSDRGRIGGDRRAGHSSTGRGRRAQMRTCDPGRPAPNVPRGRGACLAPVVASVAVLLVATAIALASVVARSSLAIGGTGARPVGTLSVDGVAADSPSRRPSRAAERVPTPPTSASRPRRPRPQPSPAHPFRPDPADAEGTRAQRLPGRPDCYVYIVGGATPPSHRGRYGLGSRRSWSATRRSRTRASSIRQEIRLPTPRR
jgi:hypothetical protein